MWRRRKGVASAESRDARKRAEDALVEVRQRREDSAPLLAFLRRDRVRNHYGEAVAHLFQGRDA